MKSDLDLASVQALLSRAADHHALVYGAPVPEDAAFELAREAPEGFELANKFLCLVESEGDPVGVIDWLEGHPDARTAYLGLLVFAPEHRGRGQGREVLGLLRERLAGRFEMLRLAVAAQNEGGVRFWLREGFVELKRHPPRTLGARDDVVLLELSRPL